MSVAGPRDLGKYHNIIELKGISKSFGGVRALVNVDLTLAAGEIRAVIGENGAGKSTLMKIIAGSLTPDSGRIMVNGETVNFTNPRMAADAGIAMVYQEPVFYPDLTVLENFFSGVEIVGPGRRILWEEMAQQASGQLRRIGLPDTVLNQRMSELSIGRQQLVLIARALHRDAKVLILDEPTSILSHAESETLFRIIRELKGQGKSVLYISHRMDEILRLADTITVLRDGHVTADLAAAEATKEKIINLMSGREIHQDIYKERMIDRQQPLLRVTNLTRQGYYESISFEVYPGEIVGLYGLVGSGRTEVALSIFGEFPPDSGTILLYGKPITPRSSSQAIQLGISYSPEDRRTQGLYLSRAISDNLTSSILGKLAGLFGRINKSQEMSVVQTQMQALDIKADGPFAPVSSLSGGNQQKVLLGRWLIDRPSLLVLDEPTRGIDIGTKTEIHRLIVQLAEQGMGVLFISSELPEILGLVDRVIVMYEGRINAELPRTEATEANVLRYALGDIYSAEMGVK